MKTAHSPETRLAAARLGLAAVRHEIASALGDRSRLLADVQALDLELACYLHALGGERPPRDGGGELVESTTTRAHT